MSDAFDTTLPAGSEFREVVKDDYGQVVAEILSCESHPNADKLSVLESLYRDSLQVPARGMDHRCPGPSQP